jgi:DNA-binding NarL/FixJ family response regulator
MALPPQILLIDDDAAFHAFLQGIGSDSAVRVVSCMTGAEGLAALERETFGLVLVDYQLPDMLGLDILEWMNSNKVSATRVLVTGYATVDVAVKAMKLGATDLFTKPLQDTHAFIRFLNRTLALDPPLPLPGAHTPAETALDPADSGVPEQEDVEALCARLGLEVTLSQRECEVLAQLLRGLSNKEIATTLFISERTVKNHVTHIFRKFDVESRPQLFNKIMSES